MLLAAAVVGVSRVLQPTSGTLERALPWLLVVIWYVLLSLASVTALLGIFWREVLAGLLIERAGLMGLASAGSVYAIALIAVGGWTAVAAAGFVMGFAGASVVRAVDIGRILVRIRALTTQAVKDAADEEESKE